MDVQKMFDVLSFPPRKVLKVMLISNIVVEPYFKEKLYDEFFSENTYVELLFINNVEFIDETIEDIPVNLVVVLLNFENLYINIYNDILASKIIEKKITIREIENYERIVSLIRKKTNAPIIWFGYEDYYFEYSNVVGHVPTVNSIVDQINFVLCKAMNGVAAFVDFKKIISEIGVSVAYDRRRKYLWNAPYSKALIEAAVKEIHKQYLIENRITKKCLVIDCDNVLWGGILSEDGIENLKLGGSGLGRVYQDFQRYLIFLYNHGIILTICSKNDLSDVLRMFREHSEMILKEEHIACFQVNWNHKADNIRRIAETLNIGLNSMVFIDDMDFEIESVKQLLPEVTAIKYERDTIYSQLSCFNLKNDVDMENIRQRNNTYKTNEQRVKLKDNSKSFEDYINALDMKIDIHPAFPIEYARIAELTQRTNKCTNGTRYTVSDIKERILSDSVMLYSVSVSDRFSNLGLVGAFEVDGETLILFSLSCRALGREIESKLLEFIMGKHQINKIMFKSTGKNENLKFILEQTLPNVTFTNCENA